MEVCVIIRSRKVTASITLILVAFLFVNAYFPLIGFSQTETVYEDPESFVRKLDQVYGEIENFSAKLTVLGTKDSVQLSVTAVTKENRLLKVEYVKPPKMKGQFFLLDGETLYQYMPAENIVIEERLKEDDLPVKGINISPNFLIQLLKSEDLQVFLIGTPNDPYFPEPGGDGVGMESSPPTKGEMPSREQGSSSSSDHKSPDYEDSYPKEQSKVQYCIKLVPRKKNYGFDHQLIWFDSHSYLPTRVETFVREKEETRRVVTLIQNIETNTEVNSKEVAQFPEGAEVIKRRS